MKIAISSELTLLPILHGVVRWQARELGFSPAAADGLALAVDEAAGNVIRCTYAGQPGKMLSLEIVAHPGQLEFVLEDSGPKVKPAAVGSPAPEDVCPGCAGTPFIQTAFDRSSYDPSFAAGNRLKLLKFLPGNAVGRE